MYLLFWFVSSLLFLSSFFFSLFPFLFFFPLFSFLLSPSPFFFFLSSLSFFDFFLFSFFLLLFTFPFCLSSYFYFLVFFFFLFPLSIFFFLFFLFLLLFQIISPWSFSILTQTSSNPLTVLPSLLSFVNSKCKAYSLGQVKSIIVTGTRSSTDYNGNPVSTSFHFDNCFPSMISR